MLFQIYFFKKNFLYHKLIIKKIIFHNILINSLLYKNDNK